MRETGPRYSLGLPEMEAQHAYLYSLFDRIEPAARVARNEATRVLLEEIERYLMFHFDCEELLMRRYGFPGFAQHQGDHENAGGRFVAFMDDFQTGSLNPGALKIFLTGWLMEHSETEDSAYVAWVKKKRGELGEMLNAKDV